MTRPEPASGFRPDLEGLRALAVLLVLVYHAGLPLPGGFLGVDVFFVLSGFLITGLLVRELGETGTISWPAFLARRARRLLPAANLVLVVTAVVGWFVVPGQRLVELGADVVAASVYLVNWAFARRAVDYLASDSIPSTVQHYWSLAVEEQYYVSGRSCSSSRPSSGARCCRACSTAVVAHDSRSSSVCWGCSSCRPSPIRSG